MSGSGSNRPAGAIWLPVGSLIVATALAAFLRLHDLGGPSLWYDEILHVLKAREVQGEPWWRWLAGLSVDRENGSLYYWLQLTGMRLAAGETGVRLMPALIGTLTVPILALAGRSARRCPTVTAVAAALLAVSPLAVYYSREGRPYAGVMLSAAALLWLALEHPRRWTAPALYGTCVLTAYWGAIAAPVLMAVGLLGAVELLRDRRAAHLLIAPFVGLALGLVLFPTVERLASDRGWSRLEVTDPLSIEGLDRLAASLTISGVDWGHANWLSLLLFALAVAGLVWLARNRPRAAYWVGGMALLPVLGWLALLVYLERWYNVRYTSAGLPAFLVLVAIGLVATVQALTRRAPGPSRRPATGVTLSLVGLGLLSIALPLWRTARSEPYLKPDWRGLATLIETLAPPTEPVLAKGRWASTCVGFYLQDLGSERTTISAQNNLAVAKSAIEGLAAAWVVTAGYIITPDFDRWLQTLKPVLQSKPANLQLRFFPDLERFLASADRVEGLLSLSGPIDREEFGPSEWLLGSGWSYPEISADGTSFRWATVPRLEIGLLQSVEQPESLRIRVLPYPSAHQPSQTLTVWLNGQQPTTVELRPGWQDLVLRFPVDLWRTDGNRVTFDLRWLESPQEVDPSSPDSRTLGAAFDLVEAVAPASRSHASIVE